MYPYSGITLNSTKRIPPRWSLSAEDSSEIGLSFLPQSSARFDARRAERLRQGGDEK